MKTLINFFIAMFSVLCCSAQSFDIGRNSRQITNQTQTQQWDNVIGVPPPGYPTYTHIINFSLFVEKVTSKGFYYRLTAGTTQSTVNSLDQNIVVGYFQNTNDLLTKTYNIKLNVQNYEVAIGVGKVFTYEKLSLRIGADLYLNRFQISKSINTGVIDPSQTSIYSSIITTVTNTPFNQYLLNYYFALHYTIWKGLSVGIQLDNSIYYTAQKQTINTLTDGYGSTGNLITSQTPVSERINNQVVSTSFLTPSISIIYSFQKKVAK